MAKVIPQSDIYNYLYNPDYKGVRGFTAIKDHSANLNTLKENYDGARLDYNNTPYKLTHGVDGISKSNGAPDRFYGEIEYRASDTSKISVPTWEPEIDSYPYTGKGFTGSDKIILPEYFQNERNFMDGDILRVRDASTNDIVEEFNYNFDIQGWE